MWHLTKFAVRNHLITLLVALILAGGSIWALVGLKIELFPDISLPFTTVATIYPEATIGLGSGSMLTSDLAIVVIGGLFSSTLLTLFVIPVIYSLAHRQPPVAAAEKSV